MTLDQTSRLALRAGANVVRERVAEMASRRQRLTEDRTRLRQHLADLDTDIADTDAQIAGLMAAIDALDPQPGQEAA